MVSAHDLGVTGWESCLGPDKVLVWTSKYCVLSKNVIVIMQLIFWTCSLLTLAAVTDSHMLALKLLSEDCSVHVHELTRGHEIFVYSSPLLALLYKPVTPLQWQL